MVVILPDERGCVERLSIGKTAEGPGAVECSDNVELCERKTENPRHHRSTSPNLHIKH